MIEGVEGVGEAVTGGVIARVLEPEAGEGRAGHAAVCLNCGTGLIGAHCHRCGQSAHVHRTLTAWWHDLSHGVLHLDGKVWRTLPLLAWRPGELTRRYVEGERARFVSPIALFLFSVFLMFAVFSLLGEPLVGGDPAASRAEYLAEVKEAEAGIDRLEAQRAAAVAEGRTTAAIDERLGEVRAERDAIVAGEKYLSGRGNISMKTGWQRLDEGVKKAVQNPSLLFYKLQANAYKFSWALIPLSVPFLWLLFIHRRRYRQYHVYDHVVFVTYSIAFMSLALVALALLQQLGLSSGWFVLAVIVVPPLHMYRQLRSAYRLSRFSALWRTAVLLISASVAMTLFFLLLLTLGVLG
jgi:hypothetical protein